MITHRYKKQGWFNDSYRHYLASKGVKTKTYFKTLADADKVTLWHGTRDKHAEKIINEGLKPLNVKNKTLGEGGFVFLTPNKLTAMNHAIRGPERYNLGSGEKPVLLKVTIPKEHIVQRPLFVDKLSLKDKETYAKQIPGFDDLDGELKTAIIKEVCDVPMKHLEDKAISFDELDDRKVFPLQYEVVVDKTINPRNIKVVDFDKERLKDLRKRNSDRQRDYERDE